MTSHRMERVNEQLRDEISNLIAREMKDPRLRGMVSVTTVETSPDLRRARVFVSVLGTDGERDDSLVALRRAAGFFRHELGERLRMKRTPEIDFRLDVSIERGARIMSLLREVQSEAVSSDTDEVPREPVQEDVENKRIS